MLNDTPKVYVGTYAKYNNGNLSGEWLELDDYSRIDEFLEACKKLHEDENDPELMFQDYENIPERYIGESYIDAEFWDYLELIEDGNISEEAVKAGVELDIPLYKIEEAYCGEYKDFTDYAYSYVEDTGMLNDVPETVKSYFDYEKYGRDIRLSGDIVEENGYFFYSNY